VDADNIAALPGGKVRQTPPCQTFSNGAFTTVRLDSLQFGSGMTFNDAADTLTVNVAGRYIVNGELLWAVNGAGLRAMSITGAGTEIAFDDRPALAGAGANTGNAGSVLVQLNAGDTLSLSGAQSSGADLDLDGTFGGRCASLSAQWVSP